MPIFKALLAQVGSLLLLWTIGRSGILIGVPPLALAAAQGLLAAALSASLGAPRWWTVIHLCFMPAIAVALLGGLSPWLYLAGFLGLGVIYWTSFKTQVPLFLSNRVTVHRLAAALPDVPGLRLLDVGSGTGTLVRQLGRLRPDWEVAGIETAPAPFALSRYLARHLPNIRLSRGDFWQLGLEHYDVVYAFLSPVPMPQLWVKAKKEMKPGSLLISNSFEVPGIEPERVQRIDDARQTRLYWYRIGTPARMDGMG